MFDVANLADENFKQVGYLNEEQIKIFDDFKCNNKVLFTRNKKSNYKYAFYIKPKYNLPHPNVYFSQDIFGRRRYETKFNLVDFFNKKII